MAHSHRAPRTHTPSCAMAFTERILPAPSRSGLFVWFNTVRRRGTIDVALAPDSFAITPAILGGRDGRSRCSPTHRLTVDADALYAHVPKTMWYTSHPYIFSAERAEFVVNESWRSPRSLVGASLHSILSDSSLSEADTKSFQGEACTLLFNGMCGGDPRSLRRFTCPRLSFVKGPDSDCWFPHRLLLANSTWIFYVAYDLDDRSMPRHRWLEMSLPTHHSGTVAIERRLHGDADSLWKSTLPTAAKGSEEEMAFPSLRGHTQPHARTHTHSLPVPWPLPSVSYRRRVVLACSHDSTVRDTVEPSM